MATITARTKKNGAVRYTAQIVIKRGGKRVHSEAKTFDRKIAAKSWATRREVELAMPGALERARHKSEGVTLGRAIERYVEESVRQMGRSKRQVLKTISNMAIAEMECAEIGSDDIVALARELSTRVKPQTVQSYLSHLSSVFTIARPAWKYPLDPQAMKDAKAAARNLGTISESHRRDRRPTLDELDKLMVFFADRQRRFPGSIPMHRVIAAALFTTRRLDELCRQRLVDYDPKHGRMMVRDMKHPGQKQGNDVWCDLPAPAMAVLDAMPSRDGRMCPWNDGAVGAAFTRACKLLQIEDLHFHDLRHDGISRLFEMGWDIPHVATVSGHRSWQSLQRYTHIRQAGDKYEGWGWLGVVT